MGFIKELINLQTNSDYYEGFLRPNSNIIIDKTRIDLSILCGGERKILKIPTNGDSSLVLRYKNKEGAVLSMETVTEDLTLVQLQGAKSQVSYQVSSGIVWVKLFGDQVEKIVNNPQNYFERISMPTIEEIAGLDSGTDAAVSRYRQLASILGLRYSHENLRHIRELKPENKQF